MDTVMSDAPSALPPDLEAWSKPARWFVRTLFSLPTWVAHAFAYPTNAQLAEWRQCHVRTIRRMCNEAVDRGELERRYVVRGQLLPDGTKARSNRWILVEGPARRARRDSADTIAPTPMDVVGSSQVAACHAGAPLAEAVSREEQDAAEARAAVRELAEKLRRGPGQTVPSLRTNDPRGEDSLSADRSIDLLESNELSAEPETPADIPAPVVERETPPLPAALAPESERETVAPSDVSADTSDSEASSALRSTSLHSMGSTETTAEDDRHIAYELAMHYARKTGQKWRFVRESILIRIMSLVAGMNGSAANKFERAAAVVDHVIARATALGRQLPTVNFIFHPQIFWKRLGKLASAPNAPGAAPPAGSGPNARPGPASCVYDPLPSRSVAPSALAETRVTVVDASDAELVAMALADNEARARRGLSPRYLVRGMAS